jgi:MFS family permease
MNAAGSAAAPGIHRPGGLLWHRDFRLLWFGETVSQLGTAMAVVAMPLAAVTVLHAGTFAVTALVAMTWLPWLLIGLPAGAWVDRLPRRAVMVACDLIAVALYASVPLAASAGVLTIGQLLAVGLLGGAAGVLFTTAYQAYLPSLLPREQLVEGNAKMQGSAAAARLGGPGLAGLVAQALGVSTALLFNAASFLVSCDGPRGPRAARPSGRTSPRACGSSAVTLTCGPWACSAPSSTLPCPATRRWPSCSWSASSARDRWRPACCWLSLGSAACSRP